MLRILGQVHGWFDKAQALADQKRFDVDLLVSARLAPDQFPLSGQLQTACDFAKGVPARLAGMNPPKFEDNALRVPYAHQAALVDERQANQELWSMRAEVRIVCEPALPRSRAQDDGFLSVHDVPDEMAWAERIDSSRSNKIPFSATVELPLVAGLFEPRAAASAMCSGKRATSASAFARAPHLTHASYASLRWKAAIRSLPIFAFA